MAKKRGRKKVDKKKSRRRRVSRAESTTPKVYGKVTIDHEGLKRLANLVKLAAPFEKLAGQTTNMIRLHKVLEAAKAECRQDTVSIAVRWLKPGRKK